MFTVALQQTMFQQCFQFQTIIFVHSNIAADLPKAYIGRENFDNASENEVASGWLNKLPMSNTKSLSKNKSRGAFKKYTTCMNVAFFLSCFKLCHIFLIIFRTSGARPTR